MSETNNVNPVIKPQPKTIMQKKQLKNPRYVNKKNSQSIININKNAEQEIHDDVSDHEPNNNQNTDNIELSKTKPGKKCKKPEKRCAGLVGPDHTKACNRYVEEDVMYCKAHDYFKNLTDAEILKITKGEVTCCDRCRKWHFGTVKRCKDCYAECVANKKPKTTPKCNWKDRHLDNCRNNTFEETEYCKYHQYVINYTDEMKQLSKLCKGCNKIKYLIDGCDTCKDRAKINRGIHNEKKIICKGFVDKVPCTFEELENGYCGCILML